MVRTGLLTMSNGEINRLSVIQRLLERRLTQKQASEQLGITTRQLRRLINRYRSDGPVGLVSRKRGGVGNRSTLMTTKNAVLTSIREHYSDFGPTLIVEKLWEHHQITISRETVRRWMMDAGMWSDRRASRTRAYQPRYRRDCFGELIQIDGSEHAWFEDRGPKCCLLVYIDDATSRLVELRFCPSESTLDYMHSTRRYLEHHGKPVAFYSDKHTVFRVSKRDAKSGTGLTQFGRALHDLNIDIIYANSSQAKGRVERMNQTLQDRLVKELRLEGISTIEDGNVFLPGYMDVLNDKFAKEPLNPTDLHRPLTEMDNLEDALCWQRQCTVSNSLTIQYDLVMYLLEPGDFTNDLRRKQVTVFDYPDGTIAIRYDGVSLPYSAFDKVGKVKQADIVSNKRLGAVLAFAKEKQKELGLGRSKKGPGRRGQKQIHKEGQRKTNPAIL